MKLILTNVGHRRALFLRRGRARGSAVPALTDEILLRIIESPSRCVPFLGSSEERELVTWGFTHTVPAATPTKEIERRLLRNPLENVSAIVLEFTTRCNFRCGHCYNANVERVTETDLDALAAATDAFAEMGVRHVAFIGGEVSKYGNGWLDLAARLRCRGADVVGVMTNGWWLGARAFEAAGRRYSTTADYLTDLREHGITHVVFSIDGRAAGHDRLRNSPGLYRRIVEGFATVREAGISPRVSLVLRGGASAADESAHIEELARRLYPDLDGDRESWIAALLFDRTNIVGNFIDFGNGAGADTGKHWRLRDTTDSMLRCAGFYRPAPHLTIKANGEISTCRLATAGNGYGNIHHGNVVGTLNGFHERFVCRLHAECRLGEYRGCVDPEIFGERFGSICTIRAIVTMIARRMSDEGVELGDRAAVARINREVARVTGHLREEGARG